ncbi:MAG: hypothetical protein CM15mV38_0660 [uncultured marine virus]|nr:MAG: hypothetical protein CM15mV38_0660 [uncultured marine virus]
MNKNLLINFSPIFLFIVVSFTMLGLSCSKENVVVSYDEASEKFIKKFEKEASAGSIMLNEGDSCQVVDGVFVVCGQ